MSDPLDVMAPDLQRVRKMTNLELSAELEALDRKGGLGFRVHAALMEAAVRLKRRQKTHLTLPVELRRADLEEHQGRRVPAFLDDESPLYAVVERVVVVTRAEVEVEEVEDGVRRLIVPGFVLGNEPAHFSTLSGLKLEKPEQELGIDYPVDEHAQVMAVQALESLRKAELTLIEEFGLTEDGPGKKPTLFILDAPKVYVDRAANLWWAQAWYDFALGHQNMFGEGGV